MSKSALPFEEEEDKVVEKEDDEESMGEEDAEERECLVQAANTFMYVVRSISEVKRLV
jgi:hypothetical protein